MKFRDLVIPGDQCIVKGELMSLDLNRANGKVSIEVKGKKMAEGILSFSIASEKDIPYTKFMTRREEYVEIIFANTVYK
jgi:hypothetical protein